MSFSKDFDQGTPVVSSTARVTSPAPRVITAPTVPARNALRLTDRSSGPLEDGEAAEPRRIDQRLGLVTRVVIRTLVSGGV